MNEKISKLVDHQVFQQIQPANSDHPFGKGIVIFANSFTGNPVEMDQRVRDALTSESTFIGNNPLVQLQRALERLEKGPWYIDCRGEVLYIHNKPYKVPTAYNYVYANENGEVLSISFKTSYRTRNAPRAATQSFDNFNKNFKATSTGISVGSEQELADQAKLLSEGSQLNGGDSEPNYLSPDILPEGPYWETHYRNKIPSLTQEQIQKKADNDYKTAALEDYNYMKENAPEVHTTYVQNVLNSKNMGRGTKGEAELKEALKQTGGDKNKVLGVFQEFFGGETIQIDNGMYRPIVETKTMDEIFHGKTVYIPAYNKAGKPMGTSYVFSNGVVNSLSGRGDFLFSLEQFLREAGKRGKNENHFVLVSKPTAKVSYTPIPLGNKERQYSDIQFQVAYKTRSLYPISTVNLMMDYYSRYFNSPEKAYMRYLMNNAMGNRTRKITEKRLEVEMRVVGRPNLTSAARIHIENIGSRSGDYSITRVIHRLSSEGYTCSLTLSPAGYKVASETDSMEVNLGKSKETKSITTNDSTHTVTKLKSTNNDSGGSVKKEQPAKTSNVSINVELMTTDEMEYIGLQLEQNPAAASKAITEVAYNIYLRASNKPGAKSRGVYHKHVNMSGNEITKLWFTSTPPEHGTDYENFRTVFSRKFYDIMRRKSENYKRWHTK